MTLGTAFVDWSEAVAWAQLRAGATGRRQQLKRSGRWWRVSEL